MQDTFVQWSGILYTQEAPPPREAIPFCTFLSLLSGGSDEFQYVEERQNDLCVLLDGFVVLCQGFQSLGALFKIGYFLSDFVH